MIDETKRKIPRPAAPQCNTCRHFEGVRNGQPSCPAYKDGIPDDVIFNDVVHNKPLPGQTGVIIYERR
jgi:hypothetical protein